MRDFTFHAGPTLLCGSDQLPKLIEDLPPGPCLLVSDVEIVRLGLLDGCSEALNNSGREVALFDRVEADPSRETLLAAVALGKGAGAVSVIGFGGGSPMDVAKL